ncbi:hypothetical protein E4U53_002906 [Claviceps sorghi]|nr:hypothetical protein E4U53_002906 [Claviceps sorghi]
MVSFKNVFLLATAVVASVLPRDVTKVLTDIQAVKTTTVGLTVVVTRYNGDFPGQVALLNAQALLHRRLLIATKDAKSAGPESEAAARRVLDYIVNDLEPAIKASLEAFKAKKDVFVKTRINAASLLKAVRTDTSALGLALIANTLSAVADDAKVVLARIDAQLVATIGVFS